jgi:hypothetical protein
MNHKYLMQNFEFLLSIFWFNLNISIIGNLSFKWFLFFFKPNLVKVSKIVYSKWCVESYFRIKAKGNWMHYLIAKCDTRMKRFSVRKSFLLNMSNNFSFDVSINDVKSVGDT